MNGGFNARKCSEQRGLRPRSHPSRAHDILNDVALAFITHPDCLLHEMGEGHPERPERLAAIEDTSSFCAFTIPIT